MKYQVWEEWGTFGYNVGRMSRLGLLLYILQMSFSKSQLDGEVKIIITPKS